MAATLESIRGLDSEHDADAAEAWDEEIERRAAEVEAGTGWTMTLDEYRDHIRARRAARARRRTSDFTVWYGDTPRLARCPPRPLPVHADAVQRRGRQHGGHPYARCSSALRSQRPVASAEPFCARTGRSSIGYGTTTSRSGFPNSTDSFAIAYPRDIRSLHQIRNRPWSPIAAPGCSGGGGRIYRFVERRLPHPTHRGGKADRERAGGTIERARSRSSDASIGGVLGPF